MLHPTSTVGWHHSSTHIRHHERTGTASITWFTPHSPVTAGVCGDDRDDGNCVWDGNDAPHDDLIRRVCHNWAGEEWQTSRSKDKEVEIIWLLYARIWMSEQLSFSSKKHFSVILNVPLNLGQKSSIPSFLCLTLTLFLLGTCFFFWMT